MAIAGACVLPAGRKQNEAGIAPRVKLESCEESALEIIDLNDLEEKPDLSTSNLRTKLFVFKEFHFDKKNRLRID